MSGKSSDMIPIGEVQIVVNGSLVRDGEERNNKNSEDVEREHAQPLIHAKAGDASLPVPKKTKFEGMSILKDVVHTENRGVATRTRSHSKSKLVLKDPKIGTISHPIDFDDFVELDSETDELKMVVANGNSRFFPCIFMF
jgi:hypothetical protein